jgi:predicted site-specific integrase-resolvase
VQHDCQVCVINAEQVSPEQEMVQDLMVIMPGFSSRLHGLGKYRKVVTEALKS